MPSPSDIAKQLRRPRALGRGHRLPAGLVLWNPVGVCYNLPWFVPFYTSPLVIHHYCGPGSRPKVLANGGHVDLLADPRLRTSLDLHRNRWR